MRVLAVALLALALAPSSVLLRYRYTPGLEHVYRVEEQAETTVKQGDGPPRTMARQTTRLTIHTRVLSVSGSSAKVEDRRENGIVESPSAGGTIQSVIPPLHRIFTFNTRGQALKVENRPIPGVTNPESGFLEGLSIPMPEGPVSPGSRWSGGLTVKGLDGKPMPVRFTSRYAGNSRRRGRDCVQIVTQISGAQKGATPAGQPPADVQMRGTATDWFDSKAGLDVEVASQVEVNITSSPTGGPNRKTTIISRATQALEK